MLIEIPQTTMCLIYNQWNSVFFANFTYSFNIGYNAFISRVCNPYKSYIVVLLKMLFNRLNIQIPPNRPIFNPIWANPNWLSS